jgi:hypothetical protein
VSYTDPFSGQTDGERGGSFYALSVARHIHLHHFSCGWHTQKKETLFMRVTVLIFWMAHLPPPLIVVIFVANLLN